MPHKQCGQIKELVNYVAEGRSDEDRAGFVQRFEEALAVKEGEKSLEEDPAHRRKVLELVLAEVRGLGEGSEKGSLGMRYVIIIY